MSCLGTWGAVIGLSVALVSSCYSPSNADRRAISASAPRLVAAAGTTFTVALLDPIDSNVQDAPFGAVMLGPLIAAGGATIARSAAVVAGRATRISGPNGSGLRLEFDSIETIDGKTTLFATLAPRQRDPSLAAMDAQGPGLGYDAILGQPPGAPSREAPVPSAIGGGPRETPTEATPQPEAPPPEPEPLAEPSRPPSIHLRRGARLDLLLTRPLAAARRGPVD